MFVPFDPDHVGCCVEPVIVEEVVGYYDSKIVIDPDSIVATIQTVGDALPTGIVTHTEYVPCRIPRIEKVLRWRPLR